MSKRSNALAQYDVCTAALEALTAVYPADSGALYRLPVRRALAALAALRRGSLHSISPPRCLVAPTPPHK